MMLHDVMMTRQGTSGKPILDVVALSKEFSVNGSATQVLQDVTFSVSQGEMLCVVGRSGCGKTTLLNILAGFEPPTLGYVAMHGNIIKKPGPDRCVVFQEDSLFPWLTVRENIAFGLPGIKKTAVQDREIDRYLAHVGLWDFQHYLPREISGGMKQRVALARVLILKPQVLLMDEPFASLDYHTRREMQNLLISLWEELGHTIVFVTHDIDEAITLADTILVMDISPGRIKEEIRVSLSRPRSVEHESYLAIRRKLMGIYEDPSTHHPSSDTPDRFMANPSVSPDSDTMKARTVRTMRAQKKDAQGEK
ncbi:MAG: ABC transporter ATP-binding protein [Desulfomonilia bacterium]